MFLWKIALILFGASMIVGMLSRRFHKARLTKFREQEFSLGITGAEFARRILKAKGLEQIEVVESNALLTDHYDLDSKTILLSSANFSGTDLAAAGTSAHVTGHAMQHAVEHRPLQWRTQAIKFAALGEVIVALASAGFLIPSKQSAMLILGFGMAMIRGYNVMTMPVEFDASGRAKDTIYHARLVRAGKEFDRLEEMLHAANHDKMSGFTRFWSWVSGWIFPWKKKG
ncbi:MAG: Zn-dependent membrane protease YugP [Verrucomicrobiales bacterium]|jgi:Zn-dependent membrane protease YugP